MRWWLLGLMPWMVMPAAVAQETDPVTVVYTYHGPSTRDLERLGDEVYASDRSVRGWGWSIQLIDDEFDVTAEGRRVRVPAKFLRGRARLPLLPCFKELGAETKWSEDGSTLLVNSSLKEITIREGQLNIVGTLGFRIQTVRLQNPPRLAIDVQGAEVKPGAVFGLPGGVNATMQDESTVRLTIDRPGVANFDLGRVDAGRTATISVRTLFPEQSPLLRPNNPPISAIPVTEDSESTSKPTTPQPNIQIQPAPATIPGQKPANRLAAPKIIEDSANTRVVQISGTLSMGTGSNATYVDASTIEVRVPNADWELAGLSAGKDPFVKSIETKVSGTSAVATISLTRPMGFELSGNGKLVLLRLVKPKTGDGKLAGKRIVIDAGHGGPDGGAKSPAGNVHEKNLALAMARTIARALSEEGVAVIMTRNEDVKIPLDERPAIANRNGADFFLSCHFNSNSVDNSRSGIIVFYHAKDPIARALAACLSFQIGKVSNLPNIGIWSDQRIYQSGFAVLRGAKVPAVLMELGFINHSRDLKAMQSDEFRKNIATAVVRGLKDYLGESLKINGNP